MNANCGNINWGLPAALNYKIMEPFVGDELMSVYFRIKNIKTFLKSLCLKFMESPYAVRGRKDHMRHRLRFPQSLNKFQTYQFSFILDLILGASFYRLFDNEFAQIIKLICCFLQHYPIIYSTVDEISNKMCKSNQL
jgi:hypothetical protein